MTLYLFLVYMLLLEDVTYASNVFETSVIVIISSYVVVSKIRFELDTILVIVNSIVILFRYKLHVCDVYLVNRAILVVMLIYRCPS